MMLYVVNNSSDYIETITPTKQKPDGVELSDQGLIRALYYVDVTATYSELLIGIQ